MAQLHDTHGEFDFEAYWSVQDEMLFWGAVVTRDGEVVGRPQGQLRCSAIKGGESEAVRHLVQGAIDERLGVDR